MQKPPTIFQKKSRTQSQSKSTTLAPEPITGITDEGTLWARVSYLSAAGTMWPSLFMVRKIGSRTSAASQEESLEVSHFPVDFRSSPRHGPEGDKGDSRGSSSSNPRAVRLACPDGPGSVDRRVFPELRSSLSFLWIKFRDRRGGMCARSWTARGCPPCSMTFGIWCCSGCRPDSTPQAHSNLCNRQAACAGAADSA